MKLPTDSEIELLHRKYAPTPEVLELVLTHCRIVCELAQQVISTAGLDLNQELVRAGCLLHDIGVYQFFDEGGHERRELNYITHGLLGEEILRREGLASEICRIASHHTGVGLTRSQIIDRHLPLPHRDFLAETPEEEVVMYVDKFHSKSRPPHFNSYDWYRRYVAQFGENNVAKFDELAGKFGKPDLAPLINRYGHALRD